MKLAESSGARERIKNAFLALLEENSFSEVSITAICKKAVLHRSTFYTYYSKKEDVLNELLYDSMEQVDSIFNQASTGKGNSCKTPLCTFLRASKRYHPLFRDPSLSEYIIGKLVTYFKDDYAHVTGTKAASDLVWFQMYGCYHMTVKYLDIPEEQWLVKKQLIDRSIIESIKNPTH